MFHPESQLALQERLAQRVTMLDTTATQDVLLQLAQGDLKDIIVLVHAASAKVMVPAFQFRDSRAIASIQEINRRKAVTIEHGWKTLSWWIDTDIVFHAIDEPDPVKPITLVNDEEGLRKIIDWFKGWEDEPGY